MTDKQSNPIIGLDAKRAFRNTSGLGSYGRTLINDLTALPLELRLYAPDQGLCYLRSQLVRSPHIHVRYPQFSPANPLPRKLQTALWRSKYITADLQRDGVQLFHGLSGELPLGLRATGIRSVVTIHDLIFLRHPEYYHWLDTKIYAWKFRQTVRQADHIIAISECTKRDILHYAPEVDPSRISVIYQSCSPRFTHGDGSFVEAKDPSPCGNPCGTPRYILSVGTIERRKNILLAVKALHHLPDAIGLVIVGRPTSYTDQVRRYVQLHRLESRVTFLHDVSNDQLPQLYAQAEAFVYPSRYEGFGIPIIEAISSGLPVVACTGSCLEEAGGPDSLYVSPDDPEAMAAALRRVLRGGSERDERIRRSREYIRRFQGSDVAKQVAELYQQVL